jgi:glycosyltransferase involved in cell wall biosynthesis
MSSVGSGATRGLTIGIDARAATEVKAGRGRVVRELFQALAAREDPHSYRCYARTRWEAPLGDRVEWVLTGAPDPVWHVRTAVLASRQCDVFPSTNSYLTVPMLRIPSAAIVHDLTTFDRSMRPNRFSTVVERLTLGPAVRRAEALWCVSRATADALLEHFPRARSKIEVIPLGVSEALAAPVSGPTELPDPGFVLAVGTLEPRKNLPRLVAGYGLLPESIRRAHRLVVVGARGWQTNETLTALRSLGERCIMLGHVSDAELGELYRRCGAFCYPSLGEGFGLPVLEAMAAGAPVVTSNLSSLPEVGGDAVEYVDPRSSESIAAGLERVLSSPERTDELSERGRARASRFSWGATAERVIGLLERIAA